MVTGCGQEYVEQICDYFFNFVHDQQLQLLIH
jgi:hypothetical protein